MDERVRGDGEFHAVMLAGPQRVHAALVGDLGQCDELVIELGVGLLRRQPLHMRE